MRHAIFDLATAFGSFILLSSCASDRGDAGAPPPHVAPGAGGAGGGSAILGASGSAIGLDVDAPADIDAGPLAGPAPVVACNGPCLDFPADPILETGDGGANEALPADIAARFGAPGRGDPGGPCLVEPESGSLFPRNWLRPRIHFLSDSNAFEIRIHADKEAHDLVVYTRRPTWYVPRDMWKSLTSHVGEEWELTISSRGIDVTNAAAMPKVGSVGTMTIAPAEASGKIVYWTTSGTPSLKGFAVGDETVVTTLLPEQVAAKPTTCVGCHTSTPDGKFAGLTMQDPWSNTLASLEPDTVGQAPPYLGAGAMQALAQKELGIETFSPAHWSNGDHVEITTLGYGAADLIWIDLEAVTHGKGSSYGIFQRDGDARGAGAPTWSHDGSKIVYVSNNVMTTGRLDAGEADLYAVPYANKVGGVASAIAGASEAALAEYYPSFSGDDRLIAFNRIPNGGMYSSLAAEVFVIPSAGGTPTRLAANDPPACAHRPSPGVSNSWPKWSPETRTMGGKTYYWMIFSSIRSEVGRPQLYVTGITTSAAHPEPATHAAIYLWNQPETESNHTPAWDVFKIPPTPPPTEIR